MQYNDDDDGGGGALSRVLISLTREKSIARVYSLKIAPAPEDVYSASREGETPHK